MKRSKEKVILGLGLDNDHVHLSDHVAYLWETDREFRGAVGFLEVGLRGSDHCVIFGYEDANERVLEVLRGHCFDDTRLQADGRLSVLTADATGDATLNKIGKTFQAAVERGAPLIRLLGNIGWNRANWPEVTDLLAFEAKVTTAARGFPCVVICMYDVRVLSAHVLLHGGMETHPVTIRRNVIRVNPHFVEMDVFLKEFESREIAMPKSA